MKQKKSATNINILLKNLKRFVNEVPINPKSPKHKAWEMDRAAQKNALKKAEKIIMGPGHRGLEVIIRDCRRVLSKSTIPQMFKLS